MDDTDVEARRTLAGIMIWSDWDWEAGGRQYKRVFELDPDNASALPGYAHYLMIMGRPDEAMTKIKRALELYPQNILVRKFYAIVLLHTLRYDEAITESRKGNFSPLLHIALQKSGRFDELMALDRERFAKDPVMMGATERGYAEGGHPGAVKRRLDIQVSQYGKPGSTLAAYSLAWGYARAGDKERTIEWLEKAYEEHDNEMPYASLTPAFELVRSKPRFQALLRRMNLPQ